MKKKKKKKKEVIRKTRRDRRLVEFLLTASIPAAGALLTLAFPPYNQHYIAWVALLPLLYALGRTNGAGALLRGYLFGVGYLAVLFWWLTVVRYPAPLGYAAFVVVIPGIFAPWAWLTCMLMRRPGALYRVWMPACLWVLLEWGMSHGTFALPWWSLGNTQVRNLVIAQTASIGATYIISFIILLVNLFFLSLITRRVQSELTTWIAVGVILLASAVFGIASLYSKPRNVEPIRLALLQANFPQEEKDAQMIFNEMYSTHFKMTGEAALKAKPDMVVWPESVTMIDWLVGPNTLEHTLYRLRLYNVALLSGVYDWRSEEENYNSVIAIDPEKGLVGKYDKIQVVPFGETFPYRKLISRISKWAGEWISKKALSYDTTRGKNYTVFDTKHGKFGAVICFESVFPQITRRLTARGAEYLFVITNDAWFFKTPGTYQHAGMAALRAIENRRYVVQASNSGITTIIDPYGRVVAEIEAMERNILYGSVYPRTDMTVYTRFGDVFCLLCLAAVAAFLALASAKFLTSKKNARKQAGP